jgi:hypothetical protein
MLCDPRRNCGCGKAGVWRVEGTFKQATPGGVVIEVGGQTITFAALPNRSGAQSPVTVSATASSGLAVTVTSLTPGVCTTGGTNGATLALVRTGPCIIFLTQAGNALFDGTLSLGAFWVTS